MSLTIRRHPDDATLLSFAAGSLAEPLAAAIASHVALCPTCEAELSDMQLLGGTLLASTSVACSSAPIGLPRRPTGGDVIASERPASDPRARVPAPLACAYGLALDAVPWKRLVPGIWHHRLALSPGVEGDLRLLKIFPGRVMPDHGHGGGELTLVLDGAYSDQTGSYHRGDVQDVDEEVEHTPIADKHSGCICLIASERPARFKSLVGRLLQPWMGM